MDDSAFEALTERLSEVQLALCAPRSEDVIERLTRAYEMRQALWNAIAAYRDAWCDRVRPPCR